MAKRHRRDAEILIISRLFRGSTSRYGLLAASLAAGVGLGQIAAAADSPGTADQLPEVIVSAQKRSQSVQDVPISVQAIDGASISEQNHNNLQDLAQTLPDVHIVNTGGPANSLNIRGIGSGSGNPAFDQSVAVFVDDIYYGRSHMIAQTFLDLDRMEVLKGPQSTFFGNNAIAGALNIVTQKPGDHFEGSARVLYGSYDQYALEGAAGGPVTDKISIRLAGTFNGEGGWIRNVDTGKESGLEDNQAGRMTAVFKPIDDLEATLKIEGSHNRITGATSDSPFQWTNCPPPAPLVAGSPTLYNGSINKFCGAAIAAKDPIGLNNNENAGLGGQFAMLSTNQDVLTVNYQHWGLTFTSVTGYYHYDYSADKDQANVGPVIQATYTPEHYDQFSQEFRVASPAGQTIEYMAGLYYQTDYVNELIDGNATYTDVYALPPLNVLPAAFIPYEPLQYLVGYGQKEEVDSAFGSATWNINQQFKLTGGLRATRDHKDFTGSLQYGTATQAYGGPYTSLPPALATNSKVWLLGVPGSYPASQTNTALMPSAGVQYQVMPDAMAYSTYTHGFKAGGFNGILAAAGAAGASLAYGPENVDSYEAGIKSKWFDNRFLFNIDAFRMDYTGLQVNSLVQLTPANQSIEVKNAATSQSQGIEIETQLIIAGGFRLSFNGAYLDAHYGSYPNASPNFIQNSKKLKSQDLSGEPMDFAAKWSGSLRAQYGVELPGGYALTSVLSPFYTSGYYNSNGTDDPLTWIKGSVRLDAMVTLDSSGPWSVDLIGKNVTNAVIAVAQNNNYGAKEMPASVALQVRLQF